MTRLSLSLAAAPLLVLTPMVRGARAQWAEPECQSTLEVEGPVVKDTFGWLALSVGDVTGDGVFDIVSTAPLSTLGNNAGGFVRVYSGADGSIVWTRTGTLPSAILGYSMQVGDWNGDSVLDVFAGAPYNGASGGHVWVFSGDTGAILHKFDPGNTQGDAFGTSIALGGDFDGDGADDVAISSNGYDPPGLTNAGRVYVYSGVDASLITTIDGPAIASGSADFGTGLSFLGDVSVPADGRSELVIGHRLPSFFRGRAMVYGYDGAQASLRYVVDDVGMAWSLFGNHLDAGRDVNGDGYGDFVVGDLPGHVADVFSGVDGSLIYTLDGNGEGGNFGSGELLPDIDGDGVADLLLGARKNATGAEGAGKVFLYSGLTGTILRTITHTTPNNHIGLCARSIGDSDGDGALDFVISGTGKGTSGPPKGRLFVVKGLGGMGGSRTFCQATPNSTGRAALVGATGSPSLGANNLTLTAFPIPAGQTGLFLVGGDTQETPFGGGFRCVAGALQFRLPVEVANGHLLTHVMDVTALPIAGQIAPGTTWHVQAWYRDPASVGSFNLTNGLTVKFEP